MEIQMRTFINSVRLSVVLLLGLSITTPSTHAKLPSLAELKSAKHETLAKQFTQHLSNKDLGEADKLVNFDAYSGRVARLVFDSRIKQNSFAVGFTNGLEKEPFVEKVFTATLVEPTTYDYLGLNREGLPIIRAVFESGGFEYVKLIVEHDKENQLRISDFMFASTGDFSSTGTANSVKYLLQPSDSILARLLGGMQPNKELSDNFKRIAELRSKGENEKAFRLLQTLPPEVRNQKELLIVSISLTSVLDEELYRKELSKLDKHHGNDPRLAFMLIDHYFYTEDWDKAISALKTVKHEWSDDAALNTLLAEVMYQKGQIDEAISTSLYAINLEPDMELPYWSAVNIYNRSGKFVDLVDIFKELQVNFSYTFTAEDFVEDEAYAQFSLSDAFKEWLE